MKTLNQMIMQRFQESPEKNNLSGQNGCTMEARFLFKQPHKLPIPFFFKICFGNKSHCR